MQALDKLVKGCAWLPDFKLKYSSYSFLEKCGSTLLKWKMFVVLQGETFIFGAVNSLTKGTFEDVCIHLQKRKTC